MRLIIFFIVLIIAGCGGSDSTSVNFLDYSLMNKTSSANLVDSKGNAFTNWQRVLQTQSSSYISWGKSLEYFYWDNTWVYLDYYRDNDSDIIYDQFVTKQIFCQQNICTQVSSEGKQKYAPMLLNNDYTLDTIGYIIDKSNGQKIQYRHYQDVKVNQVCNNPYYYNKRCLIQSEQWYDDNQTNYSLKLERTTYYAQGLGIGFIIIESYPSKFTVYMK